MILNLFQFLTELVLVYHLINNLCYWYLNLLILLVSSFEEILVSANQYVNRYPIIIIFNTNHFVIIPLFSSFPIVVFAIQTPLKIPKKNITTRFEALAEIRGLRKKILRTTRFELAHP